MHGAHGDGTSDGAASSRRGTLSRSSVVSASAASAASHSAAPPAAFSIDEYARRRKVALAKQSPLPPRRRSSTANSSTTTSRSKSYGTSSNSNSDVASSRTSTRSGGGRGGGEFSMPQRKYLDFCVEKFVDPDMKLLAAVRENGFLLKLDAFGAEEARAARLDAHMEFLPKSVSYRQICLSLGSVDIKRDLRSKFERLGVKRSAAYTEHGASTVVRSVAATALKSKHLLRLELVGVRIPPALASTLTKAIVSCTKLEFVSFAKTRMGDAGIEAMAMALGKCPNLQQLNLADCHLTEKARDHVSKIITLHGILKDESVWSSSLRGETVSVATARPSLLLDLSQNALGDEAAEAISNALYHDKWLLGLNLSQNRISRTGIAHLADTLSQSNRTLAVIVVSKMKDPVDQASLRKLETVAHERKTLLQHLAFEAREKRLLLCSVLLEWGVNRELVLEICQSGSDLHADAARRPSDSSSASSAASWSPTTASGPWRKQKSTRKATKQSSAASIRSSNQDDDFAGEEERSDDDDNQSEFVAKGLEYHEHERSRSKLDRVRSPQRASSPDHHSSQRQQHDSSASATHLAHIQTIKLLAERMSAMEEEQRKAQAYMNKLEAENQQLRSQLHTTPGASSMSVTEERIIARLEDTISSLAQQVGELTLNNAASDTAGVPNSTTDGVVLDQ